MLGSKVPLINGLLGLRTGRLLVIEGGREQPQVPAPHQPVCRNWPQEQETKGKKGTDRGEKGD